ncbi:MAG: hypothetical protein IJB59_11495 [Oscillospiraceae bacterium]|nr:hypothetical protein [Oscillospiraceae bacterium]
MVNPDKITFPITGKQLADLQRAEVGRELRPAELEMFADIANMANEAYEAAARGDAETVQSILDAINAAAATDPNAHHLAALCRGWVLLGCQRGAEWLKAAIDSRNYS